MTAQVWNPAEYDAPRRRLVPAFDEFYGAVVELVVRTAPTAPRVLDLGAGTGLLANAIVQRIPESQVTLLDASVGMLEQAAVRLKSVTPHIIVQPLEAELPPGPFDAIVSSLAIHHLSDDHKRDLYRRAVERLNVGGLFVNADQIAATSPALDGLFRQLHLHRARSLGSDETEVDAAVERMRVDQNAKLSDQLSWLAEAGLDNVDCFFRWYGFAVFGGWKRAA